MPRSGTREGAAARRLEVLELRKMGLTIVKIAAQVGVSDAQVVRDLKAALAHLSEKELESAAEMRVLETRRLDAMLESLMPIALAGGAPAIDRVLTIMQRRAKLWGLDAPTKIAPTDPTGEAEYSGIGEELQRRLARIADAGGAAGVPEEHDGDGTDLVEASLGVLGPA